MIKKMIGKGRSASVFDYEKERVLKLYNESIDKRWIENEYKATKIAMENYASVPKVYSLIKKGNQFGIVFEKVNGKTLIDSIPKYLFKIKKIGKQFADALLNIHSIKIDQELQQLNYQEKIHSVKNLNDDIKEKLITHTNSLLSSNVLCHGDYHVENILLSKNQFFVIDWMNAYKGSPQEDIARAILLLETPYGKEQLPFGIRLIVKPIIKRFKKEFLKEYFLKSCLNQSDIEKWMAPIAALRLLEKIPGEEEWLINIINKHLSFKE